MPGKAWLGVNMFLNDSKYRQGMKRARRSTMGFTQSLKGMLGVAAVSAVLIRSVKSSIAFEQAMVKMQTQVGLTEETVKGFESTIITLSKTTGESAQDIAEAMFFITSSGLEGQVALDALEASTKAAALGMGSLKEIADVTTSIMNAYGQETMTAARVTDLLLRTVKVGKIEADEMAVTLGKVIPIASTLGVSFEEVGAALAAMSLQGQDAARATTSLTGILNAIISPTADAEEIFTELYGSMQVVRNILKGKGLNWFLNDLKEKTEGNVETMGKLFGNVRALNGVLLLSGKGLGQYNKILGEMASKTQDVNNALAIYNATSGAKLKRATAEADDATRKLGVGITMLTAAILTGNDALVFDFVKSLFDTSAEMDRARISAKLMWDAILNPPKANQDDIVTPFFGGSGTSNEEEAQKAAAILAAEAAKVDKERIRLFNLKTKAMRDYSAAIKESFNPKKLDRIMEMKAIETAEEGTIKTDESTESLKERARALQKNTSENIKFASTLERVTDFMEEQREAFEFAASSVRDLSNILRDAHINRMDEVTALEKREIDAFKARNEGAEGYAEGLEKLQNKQQKRREKLQKKQAEQQKKLLTFQALISGSMAVVGALGSPPYGAGAIAMAAIVGGLVAAEVAVINGATVPSFAIGTGNFAGGLASVHEGETIRLPRNTSIESKGMSRRNQPIVMATAWDGRHLWLSQERQNRLQTLRRAE